MSRTQPMTVRMLACLVVFGAACTKEAPPPAQPAPAYGGYGQYGQPTYGAPTSAAPAPYYAPPPAPAPAPAPTNATPAPLPSATATLPLPPFGSVDVGGSFTAQFIRQEPLAVQAELTAALPAEARAKVQGVPLKIVEDPKDVNAFAGCTDA